MLVSAPFGVLAGSSFDEGHASLHGRLHPNAVNTFQYNYPDSSGQMSWWLRQLTNYRWYNHGIGGQTSSQLRLRWARDVLGQTISGTDSRGNNTISEANLIYFASSCQDNNIRLIVMNSPSGAGPSVAGQNYLNTVNKWLESGELDKYGVVLYNLKRFWSDPAWGYDGVHGNPNYVNNVDFTHFTPAGYDSLAINVFNVCKFRC
jgi:hypothetical protein